MFALQEIFDSIQSPELVQRIGWLLMHSLWQFSLIAIVGLMIGPALRSRSAAMRYWMLISVMLLMVLSPIVTLFFMPLEREPISVAEVASPLELPKVLQEQREVFDEATSLALSNELPPISGDLVRAGVESESQTSIENGGDVSQQFLMRSMIHSGWIAIRSTIGPWLSVVVALWCCGVILLSLRLIGSWLTVRRLRKLGITPAAEFVEQSLRRMQTELKVSRPVEVLASSLVSAPIVVGCFRSVILLPVSFISSVPVSQLEAILAHELAHVRRYDYLVNLLQTLIETVFFYHPAVWWLSHRIRVERENCCDDLVVTTLGNRVTYGRALLAVEQFREQIGSSLGLSARDGSLLARVRRLLADPTEGDQRSNGGRGALALVVSGLAILLLWHSSLVLGQDEPIQDEPEKNGVAQNEPMQDEIGNEARDAVSPTVAMPEDSTYPLRGWVKDESWKAVDRALVIGRALDGTVYTTTTDEKGHFSLSLPSRNVWLTLRISDAEGKRMFVTEFIPKPLYTVKTIPDMRFPGADQIISAILVPVIESKLLVVDADSQPVVGATVVVQDAMRDVDVLQTDAQGRATIRLPQNGQPMIMAFKSGVGYDYFSADVRDENNQPVKDPPKLKGKLTLKLDGAKTVRVRAVNPKGQPIAGVTVRPWFVLREGNPGKTNFSRTAAFRRVTDADGLVIFDWLPHDIPGRLSFWSDARGFDAGQSSFQIPWKDLDESKIYEVNLKKISETSGIQASEIGGLGQNVPVRNKACNLASNRATQVDPKAAPSVKRVYGRVLDEYGNAVIGASVRAKTFDGIVMDTTSGDQGGFSFSVSVTSISLTLRIMDRNSQSMWVGMVHYNSVVDGKKTPGVDEPIVAKLVPLIQSQVSVVDFEGKPVVGATVVVQDAQMEVDVLETDSQGCVTVRLPQNAKPMIMAFKSGVGYDYISSDVRDDYLRRVMNPPKLAGKLMLKLDGVRTVRVRAVTSSGVPVAGAIIRPWFVNREGNAGLTNFSSLTFGRTTDANGLAVFDWLPHDVRHGLTFRSIYLDCNADRLDIPWRDFHESATYEITLKGIKEIRGRVRGYDDKPVAGAVVTAQGKGIPHCLDTIYGWATTEADGSFAMGVPHYKTYVIQSQHGDLVGYVSPIVFLQGKPVSDIEIRLQRGTVVKGKVTRGDPPQPLGGQWVSMRLELEKIPEKKYTVHSPVPNSHGRLSLTLGTNTDAEGNFQFLAAPGEYYLSVKQQGYLIQEQGYRFAVTDESALDFRFNFRPEKKMELTGSVQGPDGQPVAGVTIQGVYESQLTSQRRFSGSTGADGRFRIERETQPAMVQFLSADKLLGAILRVDADLAVASVKLQPTFSASGRLLTEIGEPLAAGKIDYGIRVYSGEKENSPWVTSFGGSTVTDEDGNYRLDHLIQAYSYEVDLEMTSGPGRWYMVTEFVGNGQHTINLGEKRVIPDNGSTSLKDRIAAIFANSNALADRLTQLKHESTRDSTRIAVILANPESTQAEWFYRLLRGTNEDRESLNATDDLVESIRAGMNNFLQIWVDAGKLSELRSLVPDLQVQDNPTSAMILLDSEGSWLSSFQPDLEANPDQALQELLATIQTHQPPDRDAAVILAIAKSQAAREGKKILLQETAPWCGPCHELSRFIEQHREIFDRHFVWIKMDRERMVNAESIMQNIRLEGSRSIPWIAILDAGGNVLGSSTAIPDNLRSVLGSMIASLQRSQKRFGPQSVQVEELKQKLEERRLEVLNDSAIREAGLTPAVAGTRPGQIQRP